MFILDNLRTHGVIGDQNIVHILYPGSLLASTTLCTLKGIRISPCRAPIGREKSINITVGIIIFAQYNNSFSDHLTKWTLIQFSVQWQHEYYSKSTH